MNCKHAEDRRIDLLKRCENNINISKDRYNIADRFLIYSIAQVSVLSICFGVFIVLFSICKMLFKLNILFVFSIKYFSDYGQETKNCERIYRPQK